MKRHLSDSEPEICEDYDDCSSPDTAQVVSRKKRRGIIEKRRRDRINNCLMELRRLVPAAFEKQGSAKLEKAEILQMTVDHLRHLHQTRDPRGFSDPLSAYANTRAFLDYRVMGFRECVGEVARYMTNVEGMDMKDPQRVRVLNHLENFLAQRELAINAAVAASAQLGPPRMSPPAVPSHTGITIQPATGPFIPLANTRSSPPPNLSPDVIPQFSVALPTPVISFASTATVPVFGAAPVPSLCTMPTACIPTATAVKVKQPPSPTKAHANSPTTTSPTGTSKTPFRPWADSSNDD